MNNWKVTSWKKVGVADLINDRKLVIGDGYRAKNEELSSIGLPFARAGNINDGFSFDNGDCFPIDNIERVGNKISQAGDVVFTSKGTVGRFLFVNEDTPQFVYAPQLCFWRSTDCTVILPRFLYFWMLGPEFRNQYKGVAGQTDMADYVSLTEQRRMQVTLPPLPEQKAIAGVLSSFDDKIDLLRRQNRTLEALAQAVFKEWFVKKGNTKQKKAILSEHVIVSRGLSYKGSGLTDETSGIPMHNLNSVYEGGGYKYEGIKYYKGEYRERHLVQPGDIIVTNTEQGHEFRLIGFPAVVPDYFGSIGIFSQHIYKLNLQPNTFLTNQFIYYLLMMSKVREQIVGATNGTTVNMLAIDGLQRPEFGLPSKDDVVKFSEIIQTYWQKQYGNYKQIQTLSKLRNTLLPKLMKGEIRVCK